MPSLLTVSLGIWRLLALAAPRYVGVDELRLRCMYRAPCDYAVPFTILAPVANVSESWQKGGGPMSPPLAVDEVRLRFVPKVWLCVACYSILPAAMP